MIGELPTVRAKLPVLKIKAGMRAEFVVLSDSVLGFTSHWLGARSYMCPGEDCVACTQGLGARWNGFLVVKVLLPGGSRMMLLELSAGCFDRFIGLVRMEGFGSMAGLSCSAGRTRARGALVIEPIRATGEEFGALVPAIRGWEAIATLYGLPAPVAGEGLEKWEGAAAPAARRLVELAVRRLG